MSNKIRIRLKHKITLLWAGVLLVLVAIFLAGLEARSRIHIEEKARLEREAKLANLAFSEFTRQVVNQVDALLSSVSQFYLRTGSIDETERFINHLGFDKSIVDNIYLIGADGAVQISHDPAGRGRSTTDREYFQVHRAQSNEQPYISAVEKGRITGKMYFAISRRINLPDASFGGIVLASINPQAFANYYQRLTPGAQRVVALFGTNDKKIRARFPEPAATQWSSAIESPFWTQIEAADNGLFQTASPIDGISRIFVFQKVDGLPLVMMLGFSEADIVHSVDQRARPLWQGGIAITVFALMLSIILSIVFISSDRIEHANQKLGALYKQMRMQAMFDALTGLPSRPMFFDRLSKELSAARRNDKSVALLFLDLDGFKLINDEFGHDAGDSVLRTVAKRWLSSVREIDTVARLGGDEFAVIIGDLDERESAASVAQKLIDVLRPGIELTDGRLGQVGASIGIAIYPDNGREIDSLLAAADSAMYQSKSHGKNTITFSEQHPDEEGDSRAWVVFNSSHLIGIEAIDTQHRQLVGIVNKINQAIIAKAAQPTLDQLFKELISFTAFHFETEHRLMVQYAYPGLAVHEHDHELLLDEVSRIASELPQGNDLLVLQTIKDWLIDHIQNADKPLGAYLVKQGLS